MTALPQDVVTDLRRRVADLEQKLQSGLAEREDAIAQQAATALENARLQDELRAGLDRQTASAEILRTIASTSGDAERSLQQIAETTARLFSGQSVRIRIAENNEWSRTISVGASAERIDAEVSAAQLKIGARNLPGTVLLENRQIHIPDLDNVDPGIADWPGLRPARAAGTRTMAGTPLRREGKAIGALIVYRDRLAPFTADELALLQSFADQAVIAIENARLFNETREALERQTATADILKVIASSPTDVQPVFEAIATSSNRLIGGFSTAVLRFIGDELHLAAFTPTNAIADQALTASFPRPLAEFPPFLLVRNGETVEFADTESENVPQLNRDLARLRGYRSMLFTPLMSSGTPIGLISVTRKDPGKFAGHHIQLVRTFADQAVIAIENVRLFNETREALERQTATADILKIIASSPSDVQPVFEAIAERSNRLVEGLSTAVYSLVDDTLHLAAFTRTDPAADAALQALFPRPLSAFTWGEKIRKGEIAHIPDVEVEWAALPSLRELAQLRGFRSLLLVPLLRNGTPIGLISVTRKELGTFADHHVQLLQTFADQAVIAIENVRLFDQVQARTRDLTEALQQQTATADVLKVISRSAFDLQTVLDTLVASASTLCSADQGMLLLFEDGVLKPLSYCGPHPEKFEFRKSLAAAPHRGTMSGRAVLEGRTAHVPDVLVDPEFTNNSWQELTGFRAMLAVPLMRQEQAIGAMALSRTTPGPFADRQIELVTTFADQAVIAIENVRLFDEVQARTEDLRESLQFQTATSDVLKVISSSPDSLQPVLDVIVDTARHLCGTETSTIFLLKDERFHIAAASGAMPEYLEFLRTNPIALDQPGSSTSRAAREKRTVHIPDIGADPEFGQGPMSVGQRRALLSVPLMREGTAIGVITMRQSHLTPFTERQIEVVQTFADQAVIAISNVRLFEEVQQRTEDLHESLQQQTATADVLKVISRSAFDLQTVLDTLVESAARLCEADMAAITRQKGDEYFRAGSYGFTSQFVDYVKDIPVRPERKTITGRTLLEGKVIHVPDVHADPDYTFSEAQRLSGDPRTFLGVPLLREGRPVGALVLLRRSMRPFTDKQIELVTTFADQAVIAIENVRLFDEVEQRTKELAASLDELRTAQDRLVQTEKLASLGQLTAGIAHEIKNPLNFVNNFSALSAELTDELNDVLKSAEFSGKIREEVDELTRMLKDNLERVVQHGKRADSIVKNMLLHSREGSGEHRPSDINALLDESLNLAYHGARAEKQGFNVTLQRDFDASAGMIELFPQEITRVFLNLISNGFYAVTKRKTENDTSGFEPVLSASTRNLGDTVEIRIRDNGTGIPDEVKEKMFNPFFTTKPAGEGTGLGLSMSHDIIVKQHGGRIDVETAPGQFTEFTIILPRTSNFSNKIRGQT